MADKKSHSWNVDGEKVFFSPDGFFRSRHPILDFFFSKKVSFVFFPGGEGRGS